MFCLMDVSGSMDQATKEMAKRFYILLYLFLSRTYKTSRWSISATIPRPRRWTSMSSSTPKKPAALSSPAPSR